MTNTDTRTTIIDAHHGRDHGKRFQIQEMPPLETVHYVLRLLSAIRLAGVDDLMALLQPGGTQSEPDVEGVLRLLAGCDSTAVRDLMRDALTFVQVAPDPQHPGMFRALRDDDIRELKTLGDIFGAFLRVNVVAA